MKDRAVVSWRIDLDFKMCVFALRQNLCMDLNYGEQRFECRLNPMIGIYDVRFIFIFDNSPYWSR